MLQCWTAYLLPSSSPGRMSQSPPLPTADDVGPRPGKGLHFIRFWHSKFSTCFTEVLPYRSGHAAGRYAKGSWCGASRAGARRRLNNFCFSPVMLSVVSQQSLPHCWEMPRRSAPSFLLGLFHVAELTSAFVLPRLVWPFPSGNAESV